MQINIQIHFSHFLFVNVQSSGSCLSEYHSDASRLDSNTRAELVDFRFRNILFLLLTMIQTVSLLIFAFKWRWIPKEDGKKHDWEQSRHSRQPYQAYFFLNACTDIDYFGGNAVKSCIYFLHFRGGLRNFSGHISLRSVDLHLLGDFHCFPILGSDGGI